MVDGVVCTIPAHALAQVDGQEHLGLSAPERKLVADTQYNQWFKITFATKGLPWATDAQGKETGFAGGGFCDKIFQSNWTGVRPDGNGTVTVLVGGSAGITTNASDMISEIKKQYAESLGKPVDQVFDENIAPCIRNWGKQMGCAPAPKPGTYVDLSNFATAQRNDPRVGFAGSWVFEGNKFGFMENTAASALHAAKQVALACPLQAKAHATDGPIQQPGQDGAMMHRMPLPASHAALRAGIAAGSDGASVGGTANVERYANRTAAASVGIV